jgi:hypothetical protein
MAVDFINREQLLASNAIAALKLVVVETFSGRTWGVSPHSRSRDLGKRDYVTLKVNYLSIQRYAATGVFFPQ